MSDKSPSDLTGLLQKARGGDNAAREQAFELVLPQLLSQARMQLQMRPSNSINSLELAGEAYMKALKAPDLRLKHRQDFIRYCWGIMGPYLIDRWRRTQRRRSKEKPAGDHLPEVPAPQPEVERHELLIRLAEALADLERQDPMAAAVFNLYWFGRYNFCLDADGELVAIKGPNAVPMSQIANLLGISQASTYRALHRAYSFLAQRLKGDFLPNLEVSNG